MITPDAEGLHEIANIDKTDRKADIIFVHGLSGGSHSTWRYGHKGKAEHFFWPEELAKDLPQCGIWSLGHASGMSNWFSVQGMALEDRANNLALKLNNRNLGERPIIFITHSMGGLVVKEFVTAAAALGGDDWARIVEAVRGIVFLGTPHHGSHMATVAKGFAVLLRTQEHLQQMKFSGKGLDQLHKRFMKWRDETGCCVEAYVETRGIARSGRFGLKRFLPSVVVVPDISGDPKLQRCDCYRVGADHIMLAKPNNVQHDVYAGVLRFITKILATAEPYAIGTTATKRSVTKEACESYTEKISNWLTKRISLLQEFAKRPDLKTNAGSHTEALFAVAAGVDGFPGGFYTLNEKGRVIDHFVPDHPEMDIRGYDASDRDYFTETRRLHRPIICNAFRSANRPTDILVVAIPRYDDSGRFVGILDAVIDVVASDFSKLAEAVVSVAAPKQDLKGRPVLYLVDGEHKIIGTSSGFKWLGKSIFAAAHEIRPGAEGFEIVGGIGEKRNIIDTPFSSIALWRDYLS